MRKAVPANEGNASINEAVVGSDTGRALHFDGIVAIGNNDESEKRIVEFISEFREKLTKFGIVEVMNAHVKHVKRIDTINFLSMADRTPEHEKGKSLIRDGYLIPEVIDEEEGKD